MDSVFFWASKLVWALISPDSLLLILSVVTWVLLLKNKFRAAKWFGGCSAILFLTIGLFPVGEWLISPLENRFTSNPDLPETVDGILVLGGAINPALSAAWSQPEVNKSSERLTSFLQLAEVFPEAELVFSGGSGRLMGQEYRGADVARNYFSRLGLYSERVVFERDSRNTYENILNTIDMVSPVQGEKWILVTSAFHMPRSIGIAKQQGWEMIPYPVDHYANPDNRLRIELNVAGHLHTLHKATREWVGLIAYRLTGKTETLLPEN